MCFHILWNHPYRLLHIHGLDQKILQALLFGKLQMHYIVQMEKHYMNRFPMGS